ncbi:DNA phosphorothioation-dependent restriction protein DptG [Metabacillus sp. RGM 3146]|uniref:DNA phosphorothioation-dependent restriction protein DptG n=1 Tax=Metabacillus sp. RGM 3146 TaxID=3401092 RepID=UPI003B9C56DF
MEETLYKTDLKNHLEKKGKHDVGDVLDVLPFLSKKTRAIRGNFNKVLGEYTRRICSVHLNTNLYKQKEFYTSADENILSEQIAESLDFNDSSEASYDFIRFLDQYLFNQDEIKPIHLHLFNYITIDEKNSNEFKKYAQFLNETLAKNNRELKEVFTNKTAEDILTELILSQLDALKEDKAIQNHYQSLLEPLAKCYQEDVLYLSKFKDYFISAFPVLTHFYAFMYASQLIIKFEQFTKGSFDQVQPIYFSLDWEALSKRRRAAEEIQSYKYIKASAKHLFPHIHAISHLSNNVLNEKSNGKLSFMPYKELYDEIVARGTDFEQAFLKDLKAWINEYKQLKFTGVSIEDHSATIPEAFEVLFKCIEEGTSTSVSEKYGGNIEDLAANQFIKNRGNLGQVLNIKHDFLLLLTAVSVKDKRIPLKDLFNEFEKRGILLDRYSKTEVVKLYDNLNIIDKKSDSGDAQYVKPIL